MSAQVGWRLGVDIGGTFTDVALEGPDGRFTAKLLTRHDAPEAGVIDAIDEACSAAGIAVSDLVSLVHGTTLATNALIERRGAKTAFVTTDGFRDVLEMGTESRFEHYDLNIEKPKPLVPRALRFPVPERLDAAGEVVTPLDEAAVEALAPRLRQLGVEAVAIGFLHAFVNPAHERRAREILQAEIPGLAVSLSSEVSPEIREYERFSTTAANAYIQPVVSDYLRRLAEALEGRGLTCPLLVILSNGGLTDIDTAIRFPVRLVESGPAGGAILASAVARECGIDGALSFDMGGTTAKICLLDDGRPQSARDFEVDRIYRFKRGSGLPVRIPVVEMVEIGAGGGSLARVDQLGLIAVGPESAGSDPGPACYGLGGTGATVTDANLLIGRLDADHFAGGRLKLDRPAAAGAVDAALGDALRLPTESAALGLLEMVDENMANAAREHAVESGKSLIGRTMIAFGGCAPLHAARLAQKLGIGRIVVPEGAGVGSAIGFLRAPIGYEIARSLYQRLSTLDRERIDALLDEMVGEARDFVVAAAGENAAPTVERHAYMRYVGQSHEIEVELPEGALGEDAVELLRERYDSAYRRQFGPPVPGLEIELVSWSVRAALPVTPPERVAPVAGTGGATGFGDRVLFDLASGGSVVAPAVSRGSLVSGEWLPGPAAIVEDETTTIVPPGYRATALAEGHILIERNAE